MLYANGDRYAGEWKNDMMEGYGEYHFFFGDVYRGYFLEGKKASNRGTLEYGTFFRKLKP
jgi:hypothetical protein